MLEFIHHVYAIEFPPTIPEGQDLGAFIDTIYTFAIAFVGIAVFIQFIRAGLIYLLSAGNASETGKAKSMMQNAVLGAILLLSSYLILYVINPDLVNITFDPRTYESQLRPVNQYQGPPICVGSDCPIETPFPGGQLPSPTTVTTPIPGIPCVGCPTN